MAKALFRKQLGALKPDGQEGEDLLKTIALGAVVSVEIKKPRNVQHHRKFFALLNKVWENQEHYKSVEALKFALMVKLGRFEAIKTRNNETLFMPESISFAKMDQAEFNKFYDQCVDFMITEVIPGMDKPALMAEIGDMVA